MGNLRFSTLIFLSFLFFLLAPSRSFAVTTPISSNTSWTTSTAAYLTAKDTDLVINAGVTLTLAASSTAYTFNSITVNGTIIAGATTTSVNTGVSITVATNVTINSGASINANGTGYQGGQTSSAAGTSPSTGAGTSSSSSRPYGSGGGYGGNGAANDYSLLFGGLSYGSSTQPTDLGSGGGAGNNNSTYKGGNGGGAIKLDVTGTLTVNGNLSADGTSGYASASTQYGGGGSGGSLWIKVGTLAGTSGNISAIGGNNDLSLTLGAAAGAGGGGRIAIYYTSKTYSGTFSVARGTYGTYLAYPGSFFAQDISSGATSGDMFCNLASGASFNPADALPAYAKTMNNLTISNGCNYMLAKASSTAGATLSVNNLTISSGASLSVNGFGYSGGTSQGASGGTAAGASGGGAAINSTAGYGAGGGYGGSGAMYNGSALGGSTYGSSTQPTDLGSGGGAGFSSRTYPGGAGGGAMKLIITGTLTNNGTISANGLTGTANATPTMYGGSGSGGSIWIQTGTLAGAITSSIMALGGSNISSGSNGGGVGGGGRIAIYYSSYSYLGSFSVTPGSGSLFSGTKGSFFIQDVSSGLTSGDIFCDISSGASFNPNDALPSYGKTIHNINVSGGCNYTLTKTPASTTGTTLSVSNITIASGAYLNVDGQGYSGGLIQFAPGGSPASTNGGGGAGNNYGAGGGYGGIGANSSGGVGGSTYGSNTQPTHLGSGGGAGFNSPAYPGGAGGGAIKLILTGTLTVNGTLSANGSKGYENATPTTYGGGGSGGSLWVQTKILAGSGSIQALGGAVPNGTGAGAGGGGRIAIEYTSKTFNGTYSAAAGTTSSANVGGVGTVYLKSPSTFRPVLFRTW